MGNPTGSNPVSRIKEIGDGLTAAIFMDGSFYATLLRQIAGRAAEPGKEKEQHRYSLPETQGAVWNVFVNINDVEINTYLSDKLAALYEQ